MAGADRLKAEGRVREQVLSMEDRNGLFFFGRRDNLGHFEKSDDMLEGLRLEMRFYTGEKFILARCRSL